MKEFYYQIKGKSKTDTFELGIWAFPPIFSGKVSAKNKDEAKRMVEEEFGRFFPTRVMHKDLDKTDFLLKIEEIIDDRTRGLFETRTCLLCSKTFRTIDLYNDSNEQYKGVEYCSYKCKNEHYNIKRVESGEGVCIAQYPVIYKITNHKTDMCYVGKTTQPFTFRWYQHFYQSGSCKFHKAILESEVTDWSFQVIEKIVIPPNTFNTSKDVDSYILQRERHWINKFNSVKNGYNTI